MEQLFPTTLPKIPGMELAGVVDQVGGEVDGVAVGDEVMGLAVTGTYAQYALATTFAAKPASMSWELAVTLPVAASTAMSALDELALCSGETLIVHGAAGAVGTIAVQLAVARGVKVIGTASAANQSYLRSLGAIPLVYGEGLVSRVRSIESDGIDAAFDVAGRGALADSIALTGGSARVVTIADISASEHGVRFVRGNLGNRLPAALADLAQRHARGELTLTVERAFPLAEAAEAHRISEEGHARGKLVLNVD
jgi:NADPH:quinone reductase-like Zn-dependent oxidoreductase